MWIVGVVLLLLTIALGPVLLIRGIIKIRNHRRLYGDQGLSKAGNIYMVLGLVLCLVLIWAIIYKPLDLSFG